MDAFDDNFFFNTIESIEAQPTCDLLEGFDFGDFLGEQNTEWSNPDWYDEDLYKIDFASNIEYQQDLGEPPHPRLKEYKVGVIDEEDPITGVVVEEDPIAEGVAEAIGTQVPSTSVSVSVSGQQTPYLNAILNDFDDPEVPLRIIDRITYPFSERIQTALAKELASSNQKALDQIDQALEAESLRREQGEKQEGLDSVAARENEARSTSYLGVPQQTPISLHSTPGNRTPKNSRPQNIANFNPKMYYHPLPQCPPSWVGKESNRHGETLFEYTAHGELTPARRFSSQEISTYLSSHPLHDVNGQITTKGSGLRLWIQVAPADSRNRYPTNVSSKCRFENCPTDHGTIRNGEYRVAFDEQSWKNMNLDPFHNAGYVHLYCMEKNFNFPQLCRAFNVRPDCRQFAEGVNKMAITRDRQSMAKICQDYIDFAPSRVNYPNDFSNAWHKDSLTRKLTYEHSTKQSNHIREQRLARGGMHLELHLGNLDMLAEYKESKKRRNAPAIKQNPSLASVPRLKRKHKAINKDSEESGLDDDILERDIVPRPTKR